MTSRIDLNFMNAGGEMAELTRQKDWTKTVLGPPEHWPQSLKTTLGIVLNSRFPKFLWWGPELICFYNDAYRPSLGQDGKHPGILGMPAKEAWPEIWDTIYPLIRQVLEGGPATWMEDQLIPIYRNRKLEDVYWTFGYSPVQNDDGEIGGVLVTCTETTARVLHLKNLEEVHSNFLRHIMQAPVAMCILRGKNYQVEIANTLMLDIWGKAPEHVINRPVFEAVPEAMGQGLEAVLEQVYDTGERITANERPVELEHQGVLKMHYINFVCEALKTVDGHIYGIMVIASDSTEQLKARTIIEESEQRFRLIADSAPSLIYMTDTEKNCIFLNKAWLEFTGQTMESELGLGWLRGIHPDDKDAVMKQYYQAFDKQEEFYLEYRLKRKDGQYRWVSDTGKPRFSALQVFEGYIGACMDIHDQIQYQKQLEADETKLNLVIEASGLGIWELDLVSREVHYSDRYLQILGYSSPQKLTHAEILKHLHPDDLAIRERAFEIAFQTGTLHYKSRIYWNDGSLHWIEGKGRVFFDENQKPIRMIGTVQDITSEQNRQKELAESEQKFRLLADSMPQHIWTANPEGELNYYNQSVFSYTGLNIDQINEGGWIQIVHPDDRAENIRLWTEAVRSGHDFHCEHRFRKYDGEYRWQLSRAIPQRDAQGKIQMWVGTSTDIQDQKVFLNKLEMQVQKRTAELKEKNVELENMNRELQSFAYISSHDLQEPLRKIQTFSSRIIEKEYESLSQTGRDHLHRMQLAAKRMQALIEDLLAYSRSSNAEHKYEEVSMQSFTEEVLDEIKEELEFHQTTVIIDMPCQLRLIAFQFRQLLLNLIGNALKFSKPDILPRIELSCRTALAEELENPKLVAGKSYCYICIRDNGIGFEPQYGEKIFGLFQRLHSKSEYDGTGIGLAIVKKIVDNHHGLIQAKGKPGEGASFHIYIPVA